jgi:hypothetical protein
MRPMAILMGSSFKWRPWSKLCEAIVTGKPAFERVFGESFFEYLDDGYRMLQCSTKP